MPQQINIYVSQMTPKQKKELLGIYQDYLYFVKGLEMTLKNNDYDYLSYMFINRHQWESLDEHSIPWQFKYTEFYEANEYKKFVQGDENTPSVYTYISLLHTKEENDVALPQVRYHSENYNVTSIDFDLPCLVERYNIAYVPEQKMKDAVILIDGRFKVRYTGDKYKDTKVSDAFNDSDMNAEFRALLNIVDYFDHHRAQWEGIYDEKVMKAKMAKVLRKIISTETLSGFENKILDLIGAYSNKTQEILRGFFPKKTTGDAWKEAEKEHLISSAETMQHYMNIRHLMRHQWDSLDGMGRFTARTDKKHNEIRHEYKLSYNLFFDKTMSERIKEYQAASLQMQTFLKLIYPNFLVRENGESNSKFVQRLKNWQKENPDTVPMICTNYPLASDKHKSLIGNIGKVLPQTQILDNLEEKNLKSFEEKENMYFLRSWYLGLYNHIETDMMTYCFSRGLDCNRNETWDYFKKNVLSKQQYDVWCGYRKLRNNLSHNHLSKELAEELVKTAKGSLSKDVYELSEYIRINTPVFTKQADGAFWAVHNDGLQVRMDCENQRVLSRRDKEGNDLSANNSEEKKKSSSSAVKLHWWEKEVVDCRLADGIYIDLKMQKVCFPDGSRICFDREEYNFFRMGDNKMFTDKTFEVTKFFDKGRYRELSRNENFAAAKGHRIRTDNKGRVVEDIITLANSQKLNIKFNYGSDGAIVSFPDGTKLNASKGKFKVSHNGIELNYVNRHLFMNSYGSDIITASLQKSHFER